MKSKVSNFLDLVEGTYTTDVEAIRAFQAIINYCSVNELIKIDTYKVYSDEDMIGIMHTFIEHIGKKIDEENKKI